MYFTIIYFICEHDFCVDRKIVDNLQNNMHNTFLSNSQYSYGVVEAFCFPRNVFHVCIIPGKCLSSVTLNIVFDQMCLYVLELCPE